MKKTETWVAEDGKPFLTCTAAEEYEKEEMKIRQLAWILEEHFIWESWELSERVCTSRSTVEEYNASVLFQSWEEIKAIVERGKIVRPYKD